MDRILLLIAMGATAGFAARATTIDPSMYGQLKQSDVPNCPDEACGPAAAVNSFVYLQTRYPGLYGSRLVGLDPHPPYHWQQLAGTLLAMDEYMGACCEKGTSMEKFTVGKEKYIEERAPGSTTYRAQMDRDWDKTKVGGIDKPGYVSDRTVPSQAFLQKQIDDGEDVELLITYTGGRTGSHWVTLFSFDSTEKEFNFIDPLIGKPLTDGGVYEPLKKGFQTYVKLEYLDPIDATKIVTAVVVGAVSESPVPEPATGLLSLTVLAALWVFRAPVIGSGV